MGRHLVAQISRKALRHNLKQVYHHAPHCNVIAMVKANAYGHGLVCVAKTLSDVDAFGVACIEEALELRQAGIYTPIVLMEGCFEEKELALVQNHSLIQVVHSPHQVEFLQHYQTPFAAPFQVWIKLDTGMNRLGLSPQEFTHAYSVLKENPRVNILGFMTHFPNADEPRNQLTLMQLNRFEKLIKDCPEQRSLANSAAILYWPKTHGDWVRPGLMLYGASPGRQRLSHQENLIPVMSLRSHIIATRRVQQGERVGYGGTWVSASQNTKIGIISVGYGDGYPWHAKNGTPVWVKGKIVPLAGRVAMDMIAVDLNTHPNVQVGDPVCLWGPQLPIETVAKHSETIPYELFCRLTQRVQVQVVD